MIHFLDLKKINTPYKAAFQEKLKSILDSGSYILGQELEIFEKNFAQYCKSKYCIGVGNGFDALVLIFKGYIELGKLKKGDEVIVPANTYIASILAILAADLIPILVEPKLETYNLNSKLILDKITKKTKAILVVHLYGQLAEMKTISEIAHQNNLVIIQDAAQAHGATNNEENENTTMAYSFYPGKNLGALGDGGAVITNDEELEKTIRILRNYGSQTKYYNKYIGINSRLDEIQAAFLNIKLAYLDSSNTMRRAIAKRYLNEIKNEKIILPFWDYSNNHVFHLFVIRTKNRNDLQKYLTNNKIETLIHYPIPPYKQEAFSNWNKESFPITEKIHNEILSLPLNPVLRTDELEKVIRVLNNY